MLVRLAVSRLVEPHQRDFELSSVRLRWSPAVHTRRFRLAGEDSGQVDGALGLLLDGQPAPAGTTPLGLLAPAAAARHEADAGGRSGGF